jgi:hypothetical protein
MIVKNVEVHEDFAIHIHIGSSPCECCFRLQYTEQSVRLMFSASCVWKRYNCLSLNVWQIALWAWPVSYVIWKYSYLVCWWAYTTCHSSVCHDHHEYTRTCSLKCAVADSYLWGCELPWYCSSFQFTKDAHETHIGMLHISKSCHLVSLLSLLMLLRLHYTDNWRLQIQNGVTEMVVNREQLFTFSSPYSLLNNLLKFVHRSLNDPV